MSLSTPMTEARAREILEIPEKIDGLHALAHAANVRVTVHQRHGAVTLADGVYTANHLEAIAWWLRNKS